MNLTNEFKAQVRTESISLRCYFDEDQRIYEITGQYDMAGQEPLLADPVEQTSEPKTSDFRRVFESLLKKVEDRQLQTGRTNQGVQRFLDMADNINGQLVARLHG